MKKIKLYEADDKMIDLISDNYSMLQCLAAFGIRLGFGDKTVQEVCHEQDVDCYTFLATTNFLINGMSPGEADERISVKTLMGYLLASHRFSIDYQLPSIRKKLESSLHAEDARTAIILHLYDDYAHSVRRHMLYEEQTFFPYIQALVQGERTVKNAVDSFSKHHQSISIKFHELKNIIIKYLPHDNLSNNELTDTLYDIYNMEEWLANHCHVEDCLLVPTVRRLEKRTETDSVAPRLTEMIREAEGKDALSQREREIIICLVQGMTNKEIATHLYISTNTVITHRKNIARKLQIHSVAGLTIYAIANHLVD